jgi:hypothetical protein
MPVRSNPNEWAERATVDPVQSASDLAWQSVEVSWQQSDDDAAVDSFDRSTSTSRT